MIRVLATGFDTLHYSVDAGRLPPLLASVLEDGRKFVAEGGNVVVRVGGPHPEGRYRVEPDFGVGFIDIGAPPFPARTTFTLERSGTSSGYSWRLTGDESHGLCTICLADSKTFPTAKVEIGSLQCWSQKTRDVYEQSIAVLGRLLGKGESWEAKALVSRVDFAVDFQGWQMRENLITAMVTRARTRRMYSSTDWCVCGWRFVEEANYCHMCSRPRSDALPEPRAQAKLETRARQRDWQHFDSLDEESYYSGRNFTGWRWGSGDEVLARWYDKTLEIRTQSKDKVWFFDVWRKSNQFVEDWRDLKPRKDKPHQQAKKIYVGEAVWRLEVQMRREWIHDLVLAGGELAFRPVSQDERAGKKDPPGYRLSTVEDVFKHAASIWRYVAGEAPSELDRVRPRPTGWIELRHQGASRNRQRSRWPVDPTWAQIQGLTFDADFTAVPIVRYTHDLADEEVLKAMSIGCLSTIAGRRRLISDLTSKLGRTPRADELFDAASQLVRADASEIFYGLVEEKSRIVGGVDEYLLKGAGKAAAPDEGELVFEDEGARAELAPPAAIAAPAELEPAAPERTYRSVDFFGDSTPKRGNT